MMDRFYDSLYIMLYGMGGIFVVIGVIMLCIFLLNKIFKAKPEDNE